ncbi:beta-glucosidase 11-like isoform X2 [Salvia miltiorrhiza]|uniref:beta-glucosidase 11-like isoform X2 n=1 Tax=Salvia miltiorrhiza TaxID=226208 RepID=UPI0025AC56EF|nr:beta-glucosidase 11-like isoform X2 [Salvia miltiorrhiza]
MVNAMISTLFLVVVHFGGAAVEGYGRADFPADFVFGSGTAAYQYEGAAFEDGRTPSFWDTFAHSGGTEGANGDVACDGYHKYKEDVKLMSEMGLEAFRFSISWSRLIPAGRGPLNPKGLQYYNNLINQLINNGIEPHVTLYHIDLPQILEDEYGGWLSTKVVDDFRAYAEVCFREFGDRVRHWTTVNEANIFTMGGYVQGTSPPGRCSSCSKGNSSTEPYVVGHNILLAHSAAARLYKEKYKAAQKGYVGFNIYVLWPVPYTDSREDIAAAQRVKDFLIGWMIDPLVLGDYPEVVKKNVGARLPAFSADEVERVKGSSDFIGLNHYYTILAKDNPSILSLQGGLLTDMAADMIYVQGDAPPDQYPTTPSGLYHTLEYMKQAYGNPPVYIHENDTAQWNVVGHTSSRIFACFHL